MADYFVFGNGGLQEAVRQIFAKLKTLLDGKQAKITTNGILKGDGNGGVSAAVAGTDYAEPSLGISGAGVGDLLKVAAVDAQGRPTAWAKAVAGTDYQKPVASTSVSSGGLVSFVDAGSGTLFTVQLPLYNGGVS